MTSSHPDVLLRGRRRWYIYVHRFQRVGQLICRGVVATFLAACEVSGKYFWRLNLHLDNWKWGGFSFPGNPSRVMMKAWWWMEWSQLRRGTPCMFVRMYVCMYLYLYSTGHWASTGLQIFKPLCDSRAYIYTDRLSVSPINCLLTV